MLDFTRLAKEYGTPLYVYDLDGLRARCEFFQKYLPRGGQVHFAMKANFHPQVLKVVKDVGMGVDVVSLGEMSRAQSVGFRPEQIVFSGVGKSQKEIEAAIASSILQINVESVPELERIAALAKGMKKCVSVALRMNPDVDANTHPYIRTGFRENKFGIDFSEISDLLDVLKASAENVKLQGLTLHIGSQIREVESFEMAIRKTLELYKSLSSRGFDLRTFDVGGGLGMDYHSGDIKEDERAIAQYLQMVKDLLDGEIENILFEPGRILVARFGTLLTEVEYVKRTPYKNFLIVNAGMSHLMRPALYQAYHRIDILSSHENHQHHELFDVVGPICESADVLGAGRAFDSTVAAGDLLAVHDVGAYGSVMASEYNLRGMPHEICVNRGQVL